MNQLNPVAKLDKNGNISQTYIYADKANTPTYLINQETQNGKTKAVRINRVIYSLVD